MIKKRNHRVHDYQTMGKKILCAKFAERLHTNFAAGDEDNNLLLFNTVTPKPVSVLNSNTSNVSSITALTFVQSDDQVVVGSNRGSINVWDLNTLKIGYCLKGHTVEICSFYADKKNQSIIASGSFDTNAKLWDLRAKNCLYTLKNHNKRVSCVCISQDSRIFLTGGEDGAAYSFDIRMFKPIFQYELGSPVLSMDTSHNGLVAIGCVDRAARIFQMNAPFSLYGKSKSDTMPITSCSFYKDETLFTAGTDNLKAWYIGQEQVYLSDNIETSSKGIMHMIVDEKIQQIAYSSGVLSYHECYLSQVNFNSPYTFINPNNNNSIHTDSPVLREIKSRGRNQKGNNFNISQVRRANSINPSSSYNNPINHLTNEKSRKLIQKKSETIARELAGVHGNINDALSSLKVSNDNYSNRKKQVSELKMVMEDEHVKFLKVMGNRTKSMQTILELWMKGNIKSVINQFKNIDIYTASDVLSQILKPSNIQISTQFGLVIAQKAKEMIKNKHMSIVKNGVEYMLYIVSLFKDEMIRLKTFGVDKGVDLARQERIKRLDLLIEQYVQVYQSKRLKKLVDKNDETSQLAQKLSNEMSTIFKKVFGNQYDF